MPEAITSRILGLFGIREGGRLYRLLQSAERRMRPNPFISGIAANPLNSDLHLRYAEYALKKGRSFLAFAELKTALVLGASDTATHAFTGKVKQALPDLPAMDHNRYFRLLSLATEVTQRSNGKEVSVLDVGGGQGELAAFLPAASYCLAEPTVNGISGTSLPFPEQSFEFVVSCHVLEHIPPEERSLFLDQLLARARRGVILLNPFELEGTYAKERLQLVIEITGEQWAREHVDCQLPTIEFINQYAAERRLQLDIKSNGTMATTLAFVFLDYFARKSGLGKDWRQVNEFFNRNLSPLLNSDTIPTGYMVFLGRPDAPNPDRPRS